MVSRFSPAMFAATRSIRFTFLLVFTASTLVADIMIGSTRAEVLVELGKPTSAARRGTREILLYPKGVRIELEGTEVTDIKGYVPTGVSPHAEVPAPIPFATASVPSATPAPTKKLPTTTPPTSPNTSKTLTTVPTTIEQL